MTTISKKILVIITKNKKTKIKIYWRMLLRYLIVHVSVLDTGMTLILKQFWSI